MASFGLFTLTYTQWMISSHLPSLSSSSSSSPSVQTPSLNPSTTQPPALSLDPSLRALSMGPFASPFLAHTAQLALSFAMHRSKHVATAALKFLHTALDMCVNDDGRGSSDYGSSKGNRLGRVNSVGDNDIDGNANSGDNGSDSVVLRHQRQEQWRSYLPGLFSGLYAVCALPKIHRGAAVQGLGTIHHPPPPLPSPLPSLPPSPSHTSYTLHTCPPPPPPSPPPPPPPPPPPFNYYIYSVIYTHLYFFYPSTNCLAC